jgi:D-amino-acid dehydrogenase
MRVIVVGAGIVGTACAYAASRLGADVTLIHGEAPGQATAAGAGIICPWSSRVDDPAWYAFGCAAAREYPLLVAELADLGESDVSYRRVGALILTDSDEEQEQARLRVGSRHSEAPEMGDVGALTGDEARRLFPPLRPVAGAVHIAGAARVDGRLLSGALTRAASRQGAVTRTGQATLAWSPGRVTGVLLDSGELIEADAVVAATGAWTKAFLEPAGVRVSVFPERGQIAHISLRSADTSHWPVILPSGSGHYLVAFDDSRVVAGATREAGAGFDFRVTPGGLAEVLAEALSVAPGLSSGTYLETRVGFRPVGPDIRPLLGPVPGLDGLVVATGLGATGLTMGPYAGRIAARLALGLQPGLDLTPFDPLRS